MLEKIYGVVLVTNLWVIVLMEANCNHHNHIFVWESNDEPRGPAQHGSGGNLHPKGGNGRGHHHPTTGDGI